MGGRNSKSGRSHPHSEGSVSSIASLETAEAPQFGENAGKFSKEYKLKREPLGLGSFADVRLATHKRTNETRVIKLILKPREGEKELRKVMMEVKVLQRLRHRNTVKVFEFLQDEQFIYIAMEHLTGGELFDKLRQAGRFTEKLAVEITGQVLAAVAYLHSQRIVHRDLKLENVMLDDSGVAKLIDFGAARFLQPGAVMKINHATSFYAAPEVIAGSYDEKCDLWSVGVMLFAMLSGTVPFDGPSEDEVFAAVSHQTLNIYDSSLAHVSPATKDLLAKLLSKDPKTRPSAQEALSHALFREPCPTTQPQSLESRVLVHIFRSGNPDATGRVSKQSIAKSLADFPSSQAQSLLAELAKDPVQYFTLFEFIAWTKAHTPTFAAASSKHLNTL